MMSVRGGGAPARGGDLWLAQEKSVIFMYGVCERKVSASFRNCSSIKFYGLGRINFFFLGVNNLFLVASLWMYGEIVTDYC